ncbi:MAG: MATE family efflux transporter, partial [Oscillospiraceae bacterium]|nr:MATE family efflux transporter [Oscillospiraceae bacterium]
IVGHALGKAGISGVSVGGDVSNLLLLLSMGFSNAGQVIISQFIGLEQRHKIGRFVGNMFTFLMLCAVVLGGVCLTARVSILRVMNTPAEAWDSALNYSTICICGMLFIYGYNIMSAVMRGLGDSRHPLIFVGISTVLNIILDLVLVLRFRLGAGGAAIATVFSQGVSFICSCVFLYRRRESLGFSISPSDFFRFDRELLAKLLKLGIPMAIKNASVMFSKLFVNSWINSYGVAVSAFSGIANKIANVVSLFSNSLNAAGSSVVGQNIGSKRYDRVKRTLFCMFVITLSLTVALSALMYIFPRQIYSAFTSDEEVLAIGIKYLPIAVVMFFGSALRAPMNGLINGSGNYKVNFATALLDGIVLRIGLSLVFGLAVGMGAYGFWLGDAIAGFTPFFIGIFFYRSGVWKRGMDSAGAE